MNAFPVVPTGSYRFGNSGRNVLDGPSMVGVNLLLMKKFPVGERKHLQFRCEVFNVLNHANFFLPENKVNAINAGTITRAQQGKVTQLALKFVL